MAEGNCPENLRLHTSSQRTDLFYFIEFYSLLFYIHFSFAGQNAEGKLQPFEEPYLGKNDVSFQVASFPREP